MPVRVFDLEPSVAMPAVNETMREINEALQDKTMVDFILYRPHLAESLRDCVMPKHGIPKKTMKDMSEDNDFIYSRLMLGIPREVALSVARHTVAYDYAPRVQPTTRPRPPYTYSGDYKGAYAASIAIRGRDGKFLTPKEFRTLIAGMKSYVHACSHWSRSDDKWLADPTSDSHRKFIRAVDTTYNNIAADDVPRWGNTVSTVRDIWALIAMMSRYLRVPGLPDDEPIKQSPLMVGSTMDEMKKAAGRHLPEHGMENLSTTNTWALTLSLLKHMGLSPEVVSIPVLVTIEPKDLRVAERLVTTLAQSHIGQIGYNVVEGGQITDVTEPSEELLLELQYHLFIEPGFSLKQTRLMHKELHRRKAVWAELNTICETENENLLKFKAEAKILARQRAEFEATRKSVELAYNKLVKDAAEAKKILDESQKEAEERLNCHHALAILVRAMGLGDDTNNTGEKMGSAGEKTGNAGEKTGNAGE